MEPFKPASFSRPSWSAWWMAGCLALVLGCGGESLEYVEVKRLDEVVRESELETFLAVVQGLPEEKLPAFQPIFREPAQWNAARTLPVSELVSEEAAQIERRWDPEQLAREIETHPRLQRALRRAAMSPEQFVGLMLAIGTAMNRSRLDEEHDFDALIDRGQIVMARLRQDHTPFVDCSPDHQFALTRQAVWLNRVDRANRLKDVPAENVELVRKHWPRLAAVFPEEFALDPLGAIADPLEERGQPFEELPDTGRDAAITWTPEDALIGDDPPVAPEELATRPEAQPNREPFQSEN